MDPLLLGLRLGSCLLLCLGKNQGRNHSELSKLIKLLLEESHQCEVERKKEDEQCKQEWQRE